MEHVEYRVLIRQDAVLVSIVREGGEGEEGEGDTRKAEDRTKKRN